jgi:hypothetical protein
MNDNQSIRPNHRPDHASVEPETADTHELSLTDAEHHALKAALASSPLAVLLDAAGEPCIRRIRSGRSLSCSCQMVPQPLDDAATAIGLAIRFAQMGLERQVPIPRGVLQALVRQVNARNPTAILVWHWLARRGQVPARADVRPELRLVCERAQ